MTHTLKTLPVYWDAVERGDKTFEVRRDDRGFQKGDHVALVRHDGVGLAPPGGFRHNEFSVDALTRSTLDRRIRYILTGGQLGIEPGYVVLQLEVAWTS